MKKFLVLILCLWSGVILHGQEVSQFQLSTHVLDVSQGKPASGVVISLYRYNNQSQEWDFVDTDLTGESGRIGHFLPVGRNNSGTYKLRFETEAYFQKQNIDSIYPYIEVVFTIGETGHYHIPITVSANGYSTYRGS